MICESAGSLPSLAHPLFINPFINPGDEKNEKGLFRLPFPEIDLKNWDGFTITHINWVGFNHTYDKPKLYAKGELEPWQIWLPPQHEKYHALLVPARFPRLIRYLTHRLCALIVTTFEDREEIPVPLRHNLSRNELEKQWGIIVDLKRKSESIEEVFAVYMSLLDALQERIISHGERRYFATQYKERYEQFIPGYKVAYSEFDPIANKMGATAIWGMFSAVLDTFSPTAAFADIISNKLNANTLDNISNLSLEQAAYYFNTLLHGLDPHDISYNRTLLHQRVEMLEQRGEEIKHIFPKCLLDTPTTQKNWIVSGYLLDDWDFMYVYFATGEGNVKVNYGDFFLLLEAIRQQLTRGIGLLCPFWLYTPNQCCGGRNRALLEKVWSRSKPDSSCKLWKRMGCLEEGRCNMPCGGNSLKNQVLRST